MFFVRMASCMTPIVYFYNLQFITMKRGCLLLIVLLVGNTVFGQKPLSESAIKDFAFHLLFQVKYGSGQTKQLINYCLLREGYSYEYSATVIENVGSIKGYREVMLKSIYSTFKDRERIFGFLYNLEMRAINATEVTDYVLKKYQQEEKLLREKEVKKAEEDGKKYKIEHVNEIRIRDSLDKSDLEIANKEGLAILKKEEKEKLLNQPPSLFDVTELFNKSREDVVVYLQSNNYIKYRTKGDVEVYIKQGATDDTLGVSIVFKKSRLDYFSFRVKVNRERERMIKDTLEQRLGFYSSNGYYEKDNKGKEIGTTTSLKNKSTKIKCKMIRYSLTKEYVLYVAFFDY